MKYEIAEMCPHCDTENLFINLDPVVSKYRAICKNCGKEILLCSECGADKCDWHLEHGKSCCCMTI